jgi:LysR family hydrogen peroxide-inducible transcriptional activator
MDIHHIKYFLAVCEELNFTRGAERCNVTQPALSRAVQQLEDEVGGLLFRREHNLTQLTDLGHLMRPRLQQIMDKLGGVKLDAKQFLTLEKASITLGLMCSVGPTRLSGLLAAFRERRPGITLQLSEGMPSQLIERLEQGEIGLALMTADQDFPDRFDHIALYRERFLIAFPAGHRFAGMREIPMREVDGENYLRRLSCELRDKIAGQIQECGAHINVAYQSEREDWIQNMVAAGLGICFIPEFNVTVPGVMFRPVVDPEVWRGVCLVSVAGRRMSPAELAFIKGIREHRWPDSKFTTAWEAA